MEILNGWNAIAIWTFYPLFEHVSIRLNRRWAWAYFRPNYLNYAIWNIHVSVKYDRLRAGKNPAVR